MDGINVKVGPRQQGHNELGWLSAFINVINHVSRLTRLVTFNRLYYFIESLNVYNIFVLSLIKLTCTNRQQHHFVSFFVTNEAILFMILPMLSTYYNF